MHTILKALQNELEKAKTFVMSSGKEKLIGPNYFVVIDSHLARVFFTRQDFEWTLMGERYEFSEFNINDPNFIMKIKTYIKETKDKPGIAQTQHSLYR